MAFASSLAVAAAAERGVELGYLLELVHVAAVVSAAPAAAAPVAAAAAVAAAVVEAGSVPVEAAAEAAVAVGFDFGRRQPGQPVVAAVELAVAGAAGAGVAAAGLPGEPQVGLACAPVPFDHQAGPDYCCLGLVASPCVAKSFVAAHAANEDLWPCADPCSPAAAVAEGAVGDSQAARVGVEFEQTVGDSYQGPYHSTSSAFAHTVPAASFAAAAALPSAAVGMPADCEVIDLGCPRQTQRAFDVAAPAAHTSVVGQHLWTNAVARGPSAYQAHVAFHP